MKNQIKQLKSSKLFYNKWPYKVECNLMGSSKIAQYGIDLVKEWCTTGKGFRTSYYEKNIDKVELLEFVNSVAPFIKNKEVQIRSERSHFNLFCKDKDILEQIDAALEKWILQIIGPTSQEEYNFIVDNGYKRTLRDNLPKNKFQYKLFFKNNLSLDKKLAFLEWAKKHPDKIEISKTSKLWLENGRFWVNDPFMYIIDEKMLCMVGLHLSGSVKRVEEFILRNTLLTT